MGTAGAESWGKWWVMWEALSAKWNQPISRLARSIPRPGANCPDESLSSVPQCLLDWQRLAKSLGRLPHSTNTDQSPCLPGAHVCLWAFRWKGGISVSVGLAAPTTELTDITEGICTGGPGSTGMVCPLARCMTRGREPVGDLRKHEVKCSSHRPFCL